MRRPSSDGVSEYELFQRGIQISFDGSIVLDRDWVYVLSTCPSENPIKQVDYFHGVLGCAFFGRP
eukprot:8741338-Karenia_brevis.AAC.1